MNDKQYSIFDPRNPIFLSYAKWIVIIMSVLMILFGLLAIANGFAQGILIILGSVPYYFSGMVLVNMLYNIKETKDHSENISKLLEKNLKLVNENEAE